MHKFHRDCWRTSSASLNRSKQVISLLASATHILILMEIVIDDVNQGFGLGLIRIQRPKTTQAAYAKK